jgi:hypothetical protein
MNTNNGNPGMKMVRKLSFLVDEAVWHFALVAVVVAVIVDGAMRMGGGSIA